MTAPLATSPDILPDSRPSRITKSVWYAGAWWTPIYCANCGADGGIVPEENMTFAFYICTPCYEKHGAILNMYLMPDEVFWEKMKQEQLERYGHYLSEQELEEVIREDTSPLARLIKQRR